MHIVVCVKAVPSSTEVKMDPVTHTIVRDGRESVVNPFDAAALEVALAIKDERAAAGEGCRVSVLSMGIPATEALLRDGIARGASDALLLSDRAFAGADTLATSYALSCGIRELGSASKGDAAASGASEQRAAAPGSAAPGIPEGGTAMPGSAVSGTSEHGESAPGPSLPDLILCGKMAVDGDTAQIGPELAGLFDMPCVTDVRELVAIERGRVTVRHATDAGIELVEVPLPAVLTVAKDIAQPRMPSIAGVRAAAGVPVAVLSAACAQADPARSGLAGSPTQVVRSFVPERSDTCEVLEGSVPQQAARIIALAEEAGL
ncbi:MAG TPA: electron transfer flavoprotein subunit beta/FixA family protein [Enorma massiliensis]|uniref:electron transfer flavoprotein subunit beta/FixA family protein n=1 Tax=Enorma massiliensis TaxID=1472761 RepID=UPI001D8C82E9|nr:electron transfer flavoprotein subunit beta/FixA family protein [Enorma massiliensis]HJG63014.1 electron transfer flavoprotein subunit beta/FixA family protein [Enorma massiliensis]